LHYFIDLVFFCVIISLLEIDRSKTGNLKMRVYILCGGDILKIKNEVDHILQDEQNRYESKFHNHRCSAAIFLIQQ
jgi:hypothetical protein